MDDLMRAMWKGGETPKAIPHLCPYRPEGMESKDACVSVSGKNSHFNSGCCAAIRGTTSFGPCNFIARRCRVCVASGKLGLKANAVTNVEDGTCDEHATVEGDTVRRLPADPRGHVSSGVAFPQPVRVRRPMVVRSHHPVAADSETVEKMPLKSEPAGHDEGAADIEVVSLGGNPFDGLEARLVPAKKPNDAPLPTGGEDATPPSDGAEQSATEGQGTGGHAATEEVREETAPPHNQADNPEEHEELIATGVTRALRLAPSLREILKCLPFRPTNAGVADAIGKSMKTVENGMTKVYSVLGIAHLGQSMKRLVAIEISKRFAEAGSFDEPTIPREKISRRIPTKRGEDEEGAGRTKDEGATSVSVDEQNLERFAALLGDMARISARLEQALEERLSVEALKSMPATCTTFVDDLRKLREGIERYERLLSDTS